ncbi:alpha/beta hydrolase [Zavarzinia compransoris]|uniref:Esterase n=1 Tax=Zavarzinia compransoris TaxID=1264899 RepID=A0A317DT29_9PROT|nr:alpha/beta hydrolase-fold protein [Zavarzinia compransoris]PWR17831.1 esterase [Zavarzinia compransoris]TDP49365.1 hypothetical protein DES42_101737 [Zavarzinia compransoris]
MAQIFALQDTEILDGGGGRRLALGGPLAPAPAGGMPVLYVLDGEEMFATVVESLRRACRRPGATGVAPALVVGIGTGPRGRAFDFAPGPEGGADAFLAMIADEIFPLVAARHPEATGPRFLFGHSLAGFLALYALATRPALFDGYVAASPSIWRDPARLFQGIGALPAAIGDRALRVMTAVGTWEQDMAPWQAQAPDRAAMAARRADRRMVDNTRDFAAALAALALPGLTLRHETLPGEDHASIVPIAIAHGLRFLTAPPALLKGWPQP